MKTEVIRVDPKEPQIEKVKRAARVIREGGLVVIPTETVYGIAANMLDRKAIQRLYTVKQRPQDKPFSLHIASKEDVEKYAWDILPFAWRLMEKFWPGPMTLLLKSRENNKVGVRMPDHKVALAIIKDVDLPLACPSANLSGNPAPSTCQEVLKDLDGLIDLVVDSGKTTLGQDSTVIDATRIPVQILRQGSLSKDEVEKIVNKRVILFVCAGNSCRSVMAKAILEKKLKERKRDDIEVLSAGIMMLDGLGASEQTEKILEREGIDVSMHHSQGVSQKMIKEADIILVMERSQEARILEISPEVKNRLFLLKEFAKIRDNDLDIADPIGKSAEFYEQVFGIIKEAVEKVAQII
ncbi:MAG: threonylcarbamoyl-AMP synthase [Candidatus Omnitrophica bacterium]|nr:threonylcarbamoyl-AMP synthase [Candidatus Omnitrophota bacterium]MBU4472671.1 threonylcarbamoyl-AMP synthase [Candidatus Omnitrophota bacterium]MCG2706710.1 threonylcarbamoyl-AMP synthase [Candidatus Omnitrophota bacterium]